MNLPRSAPKPGDLTRPAWSFWAGLGVVGVFATAAFSYDVTADSHVVDESTSASQTYFASPTCCSAVTSITPPGSKIRRTTTLPFPQFLIGGALKVTGYRHLGPASARLWYRDTSNRVEPPGALMVTRLPAVVLGEFD